MTSQHALPNVDTRAEQALLGAMLINPDSIPTLIDHFHPDDLYQPKHHTILTTILDTWQAGIKIDPIVIAEELSKQGELQKIGGAEYIHTLTTATPTAANSLYHAQRLRDTALIRRIHHVGNAIAQTAQTETDAPTVLQQTQALINTIERADTTTIQALAATIETTMTDLVDQATGQKSTIIQPTGFYDFDDITDGGLRGGQMVIVAARPGVGKSTWGIDVLRQTVAQTNRAALLFTLEMSATEVTQRILSAESGVPLREFRRGTLTNEDNQALFEAIDRIEQWPIYIDDSPNLTLLEIRAKAKQLAAQNDLGIIMVDYLQLLTSGRRVESRQQEVSEFSRQLKLLAKELNVPVIAVAQLNRDVEQRGDDAIPRLSDLRESGSLEQDADMVILIHRPDSKNKDHERAGEADLVVAKHRGGSIGTITIHHDLARSKFTN